MKKTIFHTVLSENNTVQIVIEGDFLIRDSMEIKEELLTILEDHKSIEVLFKSVERLDLAALQLLAALSRSAAEQEKLVKYNFEKTEYIRTILSSSGYDKFLTANDQNEQDSFIS